jgi:hypothetical protein
VYDRGENEEHFIPFFAITGVSVKGEADHRESPPLSGRLTAMSRKISLRPAGVEPTTSGPEAIDFTRESFSIVAV